MAQLYMSGLKDTYQRRFFSDCESRESACATQRVITDVAEILLVAINRLTFVQTVVRSAATLSVFASVKFRMLLEHARGAVARSASFGIRSGEMADSHFFSLVSQRILQASALYPLTHLQTQVPLLT